jgi:hypothetical protein
MKRLLLIALLLAVAAALAAWLWGSRASQRERLRRAEADQRRLRCCAPQGPCREVLDELRALAAGEGEVAQRARADLSGCGHPGDVPAR